MHSGRITERRGSGCVIAHRLGKENLGKEMQSLTQVWLCCTMTMIHTTLSKLQDFPDFVRP